MTRGTNILVPASAHAALESIRVRRGYRSRNQVVHTLLSEYVCTQQVLAPEARLMHLATLLRYPPPRKLADLAGESPGKVLRIPFRNDHEKQVWETARSLGFRLPGQSRNRGHPDYQARPGTDALLTAIARIEALDDPRLGDYQLLTRRQAHGLWRLVVEATRSRQERHITALAEHAATRREITAARQVKTTADSRDAGEGVVSRVEFVARQLEQEVTWHSQHRFDVAASIAHDRLTRPDRTEFLRLLDHQDRHNDEQWLDEVARCRAEYSDRHEARITSREGRGATAVWRAERAVAADDLIAWIRRSGRVSTSRTLVMTPPGWSLRIPGDWVPTIFPSNEPLNDLWSGHLRAGRVLELRHGNEQMVWPTRVFDDGTPEPVTGMDAVIGQLGDHTPHQIVESLLFEQSEIPVPAHIACDLGLISADQRDALVDAAAPQRGTGTEPAGGPRPDMDHDLALADIYQRFGSKLQRQQARMAYARGQRAFVDYLGEIGYPWLSSEWFSWGQITGWTLQAPSLAAAVDSGHFGAEALCWLAEYVRTVQQIVLYDDTRSRWTAAILHNPNDESADQKLADAAG